MNKFALSFAISFEHLSRGKRILEVGSRRVNNANGPDVRTFIPVDIGVDMIEGPGVDVIAKGEDLPALFGAESFGMIFSLDTFEHVEKWREFLRGIWGVLKKDGILVLTAASKRKGRHNYPSDYWRLNEDLVREIFKGNEILFNSELEAISFGLAVIKKTDTLDGLEDIRLIRVDDQVPADLV